MTIKTDNPVSTLNPINSMTKDNSINPTHAVNSTDSVDTINTATSDNLFNDEQTSPDAPIPLKQQRIGKQQRKSDFAALIIRVISLTLLHQAEPRVIFRAYPR